MALFVCVLIYTSDLDVPCVYLDTHMSGSGLSIL